MNLIPPFLGTVAALVALMLIEILLFMISLHMVCHLLPRHCSIVTQITLKWFEIQVHRVDMLGEFVLAGSGGVIAPSTNPSLIRFLLLMDISVAF